MTDRLQLSREFLAQAGWGDARRAFLAGDASDRRYERLWRGDRSVVLMDAPPGQGDDPADFIRIAAHLRGIGLSAPEILAEDLEHGFLLVEDLGDGLYARLLEREPEREASLYLNAVDALVHLHRHAPPAGLSDLSAADWAEAAAFAFDWYAGDAGCDLVEARRNFIAEMANALQAHADGPRVLILRDFHAENLLDLPSRTGVARVGLLDFQLAQMGQPGYDLISLLQDARRDVSTAVADQAIARFAHANTLETEAFSATLATLGAQRALRIIGVFARLCLQSGKPGYLRLVPRVWGYLQNNLAHPTLRGLRAACAVLPAPTGDHLARIAARCPTISR